MPKMIPLVMLILLGFQVLTTGAAVPVTISHGEWTLMADTEKSELTLIQEKLGIIAKEIRLNLRDKQGNIPIKGWSVTSKKSNQLIIHTIQPRNTWVFDLKTDLARISSTVSNAVLTAKIPAPSDRNVARLLDAGGVPVDWVGTDEAHGRWGTIISKNRSFLPAHNAETMHFALGQVASSNLHALFDRKTGIAIEFSDNARMSRNLRDRNLLDLELTVPGNSLIRLFPDYYTKVLGAPYYVPFDDSVFSKAPMVWCSWTAYYHEAKEKDIIENTDWLSAHLKPYGFQYVQIDDGYDRGEKGEHYWIEKWDPKIFPHGPQWIANYIKTKGLHPGLWLVPNVTASYVKQHPEWYLYDKKGNYIWDYSTPSLDSTNPEVLTFLKKLFTTLKEWGYEYYKFDGENALPLYVPNIDVNRLHDKTIDPLVAYRNRLKIIRDTIGPGTFVEGCPAGMPLNGIGYFNSCFTGDDVFNNWQGMYALFSSINANAFLNHMVVYVMPGEGIEIGPRMTVEEAQNKRVSSVVATARTREKPMTGFGTTLPEARTLTTMVSLTGVVYPLASVMPELPEERVRLLKMTMPTMPILPVDLFSRGTDMQWNRFMQTTTDDYIHNYPEILDLKVNSKVGTYDVVGLTNWRSETLRREISLPDQLGLRADTEYAAFDFWNQKFLGVVQDKFEVAVEPHDTKVLFLHPLSDHPQLVGMSRHISGTYSILDLRWDGTRNILSGSSETVPGEAYSLFFHIPEGTAISVVTASLPNGPPLPIRQEQSGRQLMIQFQGQPQTVNWQIGCNAGAMK